MTTLDLIQYAGVALGLAGSLLVPSARRERRRIGFGLWIVSNAFLITWTIHAQAFGLLGMYAFYSATSLAGWWNNRAPRTDVVPDRVVVIT